MSQKVAQKKVQVRGKLGEIVSIPPTGFVRFKCGTRLAGSGETLGNYSQRDLFNKLRGKKNKKKTTLQSRQSSQTFILVMCENINNPLNRFHAVVDIPAI